MILVNPAGVFLAPSRTRPDRSTWQWTALGIARNLSRRHRFLQDQAHQAAGLKEGCGNGLLRRGRSTRAAVGGYRGRTRWSCGDAVHQSGEACDDGNEDNQDGCLTTCQPHRCGDGLVRAIWKPGKRLTCDDGNADPWDGCGHDCNRCGDGARGFMKLAMMEMRSMATGTGCRLDTCGDGVVDQVKVAMTAITEADGCPPTCLRPKVVQRSLVNWVRQSI